MRRALIASLVVIVGGVIADQGPLLLGSRPADAVVGRPLTPASYAGVARRTARRTTRRTVAATAAVSTLPAGCIFATGVYTCGTVRYRPYYDGPTVVYQVVD